jgi:branched-chain amino acid transport system substrate-binding protein
MFKKFVVMATMMCFVVSVPILSSAQSTKPLKFGVVYAMSGATALLSEGIVVGHRIAAEEIMKAGGFQGRRVEIITRDDTGNPELTTRFCRELVIKEQVDWLLTGQASGTGLAAAAVAKEHKQPTFIIGGATEKITTEEWNPYIYRYRTTSTAEARAMARIAAGELLKDIKNPRIYWISWDYEYGRSLFDPFVAKLKELKPDAKIVGEGWPRTGEVDYGPFISQMLAVKPHLVVNAIWAGGLVSLLKQGNDRGLWNITKLISAGEMMGIVTRTALGKNLPAGSWGCSYDDPSWPQNEGQKKFYKLYSDFIGKPNSEPPDNALAGYNMVHFINKGMQTAKTTDGAAVLKAMEGMSLETYQKPVKLRDFDHQSTAGYLWGPAVEKPGLPYMVMDGKQTRYVSEEKDLFTKEEWLAKRKAAGKQ